jgi:hypothetical protein
MVGEVKKSAEAGSMSGWRGSNEMPIYDFACKMKKLS